MFNFLKDRSTNWQHIEISRLSWFLSFCAFNLFSAWLAYRGLLKLGEYVNDALVLNGGHGLTTTIKSVAQRVGINIGTPPTKGAE